MIDDESRRTAEEAGQLVQKALRSLVEQLYFEPPDLKLGSWAKKEAARFYAGWLTLTDARRRQFLFALGRFAGLTGFHVVEAARIESLLLGFAEVFGCSVEFSCAIISETSNAGARLMENLRKLIERLEKAERRAKCVQAKKEKKTKRCEIIDSLIAQGFSTENCGEAIHKHILEHHEELLKIQKPKGKRLDGSNKKYISKESMWKTYRRQNLSS